MFANTIVSSPELKAQVLLSVVCLSVRLSVNFSFLRFKAQVSFSDQNLSVVRHCRWRRRKLFTFSSSVSRTFGPISTKLGTNHLLVKGIQVCSTEGLCPFPRGDNYKIAKIHTTWLISTKLSKKHPWVKRNWVC